MMHIEPFLNLELEAACDGMPQANALQLVLHQAIQFELSRVISDKVSTKFLHPVCAGVSPSGYYTGPVATIAIEYQK